MAYSACLCFALDSDEQKRCNFQYQYSVYQLEYSRNLLFKRIKPLMAGIIRRQGRPPKIVHPVDQHYQNLREELYKTFETLGVAVA